MAKQGLAAVSTKSNQTKAAATKRFGRAGRTLLAGIGGLSDVAQARLAAAVKTPDGTDELSDILRSFYALPEEERQVQLVAMGLLAINHRLGRRLAAAGDSQTR